MDRPDAYPLGFTAASLRPELARIVAESFLAVGDWQVAKARILATNALQCRSAGTAVRLERALRQRLQRLTEAQLVLLARATAEDRAALAWLAAIKEIPFVFDFAAELLRDKLAALDPVLRLSDYETFVDQKAVVHPVLGRLTAATRTKLRNVLLRMLTEAGLLLPGVRRPGNALGTVLRPVLSPAVATAIQDDDPRWLAGFLVPDAEIPGP